MHPHHGQVAWIPLDSSVIAAVSYRSDTEQLDIRFTNGHVYRYEEVPAAIVRRLIEAESAGECFNLAIRDSYEYEQLD